MRRSGACGRKRSKQVGVIIEECRRATTGHLPGWRAAVWRLLRIHPFRVAALVSVVLAANPAFGGKITSADTLRERMPSIDQFLAAEIRRQKLPGLALGIVSAGTVVTAWGYGYANVELSVPVSEDTVFQSGSLGKAFTAMAVMLQVEDGKIELDAPLTKYFPEAPPSWASISVRNVLNHTSGIPEYDDQKVKLDEKPVFDYRRDYSDNELIRIVYRLPLDFPPGSQWKYSDTGYAVLGILVNRVSGRFYGDVLMDRVFRPLGMKTARIISEADIIKNRAAGYRLVHGELRNQEWVSPTLNTMGDGSLYLSIRDYTAWDRGLRDSAILKQSSWAEVYTPAALKNGWRYPYGFGWAIEWWHGKPWYHHSGGWQGFSTCMSRYLADDLTIIVLANLAEGIPAHIIDGIARLIDPELPKLEHHETMTPPTAAASRVLREH
jgi:CubicO group peptidase (beta-lactamase class C family)